MMNYLRRKLWRNIFGLLVMGLFVTKFFTFSLAPFLSSDHSYAIEKSSEENKGKEEESFDKLKKKLLICDSSPSVCLNAFQADQFPANKYSWCFGCSNFPAKNVPTPPPDALS
ncbi:hypothetical protein ACTJKC_01005 [Pedobacter sp. 22226]|uniref:hypothetical protein n=1 Tax=Pedobacter sp. 22226 TaxID=3453894 RepID=UPI003F865987